jgi:glycosyltransferase involved in cell wall biosynthesis
MIFFSVVVPCYNVENNIIATLESLNNQLFKLFEVIFVNDGSYDKTVEVIQGFKKNFNYEIVNQENKGLGAARNLGIKKSNAKYICLLDADDSWESNKLEKMNEILINDNSIDIICHNEFIKTDLNKLIKKNFYGPYCDFESLFFKGNCLSPSAVTMKKEVFNKVGYFTEDRNFHGVEDYDMWLKMSLKNLNFYFCGAFLGNYIIHENNMSGEFKFFEKEELILLYYSKHINKSFKNSFLLKKRFLELYLLKLIKAITLKNFKYLFSFSNEIFFLFIQRDFYKKKFDLINKKK